MALSTPLSSSLRSVPRPADCGTTRDARLVAHDRHEKARGLISAITDKPLDDESVGYTLLDIQSGLEEEHKGGPVRFAELFTWGETQNLRRLILTISVQLGQQFSGSNMIKYYAPVIFQNSMGSVVM